MFTHNLDPIIFSIGPLAIRWYSMVYLIGFLVVYKLLKKPNAKNHIKNWKTEYTDSYITWLFLGLLIGARLMHVIMEIISNTVAGSSYLQKPWLIFFVWNGGLSFHGALIGIIISTYYFSKKYKINFYELADFIVIPASLFLVFGRIANFINAEMVGTITSVPWCVNFPGYEGCRHPTVLYEGLQSLFIFLTLLYIRKLKPVRGIIFYSFITLYGLIRFFLMYLRDETKIFLGLTLSQMFSGIMFIVGSYFLWDIIQKKYKDKKK